MKRSQHDPTMGGLIYGGRKVWGVDYSKGCICGWDCGTAVEALELLCFLAAVIFPDISLGNWLDHLRCGLCHTLLRVRELATPNSVHHFNTSLCCCAYNNHVLVYSKDQTARFVGYHT